MSEFKQNWDGSLTFEKVVKYLPHFKSAIQEFRYSLWALNFDIPGSFRARAVAPKPQRSAHSSRELRRPCGVSRRRSLSRHKCGGLSTPPRTQ